jgi:hypothetical protein
MAAGGKKTKSNDAVSKLAGACHERLKLIFLKHI